MLTAEYNHGYPAVLKNAMDWTFVEWRRKPITFVGWGNVGGARADRAAAPGGASSSRWHRCGTRCTSCPTSMIPVLRREDPADLSPFAALEPKLDLLVDDLALVDGQRLPTARARTRRDRTSAT